MDIINEFHKAHRNDRYVLGRLFRDPIRAIECMDGFHISVQASEYSYCSPRTTYDGTYSNFECGYPNAPVPELRQWKEGGDETEDTQTVYGYVPVAEIVALIEKHGGIKGAYEPPVK